MLTVCEVHCCAAAKLNGDMDWYRILQLEQFAEESSIKKQYRKLALQLHPDKNKFSGAEAAFKIIGEANMTLSDRAKRYLYDNKLRLNASKVLPRKPPQPPTRPSVPKTQPVDPSFAAKFTNLQQSKSSAFSNFFWAMCQTCCQRYMFPAIHKNKHILCQRCGSKFTASEVNVQDAPVPGMNSAQPSNLKQGVQQNVAGAASVQKSHSSSGACEAQGTAASASKENLNDMATNTVHSKNVDLDKNKKKPQAKRTTVNSKRKRGRKLVVESSDSDTSDDSVDIRTNNGGQSQQNAATSSTRYPRRSNREKQNATYKEKTVDDDDNDDFISPPKRLRKVHKESNPTDADGVQGANDDANNTVDSSPKVSPVPGPISLPDPEFGNFESEKVESKFEAGQIWAVYDNLDGMPRFYVRIREVRKQQFKLYFNWLEHNTENEKEIAWTKAELPVASGNYMLGKSDSIDSQGMFSHLMCWEKCTQRNMYNIYPRKREVWALYKGWDFNWISDAKSHKLYEYEIVQVLDIMDDNTLVVHNLVKIEGFLSLFMPAVDKGSFFIPSTEVLRFSHKVPSYRLTGDERDGTLKGCLELDIASLPDGFAESFPSVIRDSSTLKDGKFDAASINLCSSNKADEIKSPSAGSPLLSTVGVYHDFEEDKSIENIKRGQIWALYSDLDQYPNYYARIRSIEDSTIYFSWIEFAPQSTDEKEWQKKGMPCSCGRFKAERKVNSYDSTDSFSHMVDAVSSKRDLYDIYPQTGEVWALYKNWSMEWTKTNLENCDYDVVEVLERSESLIKVAVLIKVSGHITVFKRETKGEAANILEIPVGERLRFSHQIHAFRITEEESSELEGHWELHSPSLPRKFL